MVSGEGEVGPELREIRLSLGTRYVCSASETASGDVRVVDGKPGARTEGCGVESSVCVLGFLYLGPRDASGGPLKPLGSV